MQKFFFVALFAVAAPFSADCGAFQGEKVQKGREAAIEAKAKDPGGKPVNGLVASAEIVESKGVFKIRLSLKNASEKPITVCDYVGSRSLEVDWTGPDGKALKSNHYDWLALALIAPLGKSNFVTIPPGGVRIINHGEGVAFQPPAEKPARRFNVAQPGQHKVTVSFVQNESGKQFGLENVWTGTVSSNEVTFTVK